MTRKAQAGDHGRPRNTCGTLTLALVRPWGTPRTIPHARAVSRGRFRTHGAHMSTHRPERPVLRENRRAGETRRAGARSTASGAAGARRSPPTPPRPPPPSPTAGKAIESRKCVEAARERHHTRVSEGVSKGSWEWISWARGGCGPLEAASRWRPVDLRWWVSRRGNREGGDSKLALPACPQNGQDRQRHKRPYSESMDQGRGGQGGVHGLRAPLED